MTDVSLPSAVRRRLMLTESAVMLGLTAVMIVAFIPLMIALMMGVFIWLDHNQHQLFAQSLYATGQLPTPHVLYHVMLNGLYTLTGSNDWRFATALAMTLPHIAFALITYVALRLQVQGLSGQRWVMGRALCVVLAVLMVIAVPINIFLRSFPYPADTYLMGFITPTTYHNPTQTLLRPLALLLFIAVYTFALIPRSRTGLQHVAVCGLLAGLVVICGISKPNFILILLPALAVWNGLRLLRRQSIAWLPGLVGIALPGVVLLAGQYAFTFSQTSTMGNSTVVFRPFGAVMQASGLFVEHIILFSSLSLLFPAIIYILYFQHTRHDKVFNFAWLLLIFGVVFMLLLAETGPRADHANFVWSGYIAQTTLHFAVFRTMLGSWVADGRRPISPSSALTGGLLCAFIAVQGIFFLASTTNWIGSLNVLE